MKFVMPKRAFSLTLALTMSVSLIPAFNNSMVAKAAGSTKTITGLGTGTISDPVKGSGQWNYVYYGKYNDESVKYRVLDVDSNDYGNKETMLLDCDNVLYPLKVDSDSDLVKNLNNAGFYDKKGVFTTVEKVAIAFSKKETKSTTDGKGVVGDFEPLTEEKVFALDPAEATNTSYGYGTATLLDDNKKKKSIENGKYKSYWLRLDKQTNLKDVISQKLYKVTRLGSIIDESTDDAEGISPAFNVERSSILFSSSVQSNAYKLTLIDMGMSIPEVTKSETNGSKATITFTYPDKEENKDLAFSVILLKNKYEKGATVRNSSDFAYLPVNVISNNQSGNGKKIYNYATGTIKLPSDYSNYKYAYIVSEKNNGSTETDYASVPQYFDLNTDDHVHEWKIDYLGAGDDNAVIKCENCDKKYTVSITAASKEYGEKPSAKINKPSDLPSEIEVSDVIYRDRKGNEIDASEITEVGEYTAVAVIAVMNEDGSEQIEEIANNFKITPIVLLPTMVKLSEERYIYDGTPKTPDVTVTVKGKVLNKDEYEVEYKNNIEPGVATAVVNPISSNYTKMVSNSYRIVTKDEADKEDKLKDKIDEKKNDADKNSKDDEDLISKIEDKYKDATKTEGKASNTNNNNKDQVIKVNAAASHNVGDVVNALGDTFVVTSADDTDLTVTFMKARSETVSSITIPSSVVIDGNEYRVTEIAENAFNGNKKLKRVVIGENIEKIGAKAFYKCKKLKKVIIETTYLKKKNVGKQAFKKIHKEAKVIVPENKLKSYSKILKSRGINGDSQKITK